MAKYVMVTFDTFLFSLAKYGGYVVIYAVVCTDKYICTNYYLTNKEA